MKPFMNSGWFAAFAALLIPTAAWPSAADSHPVMILIPGAGSSGGDMHMERLFDWVPPKGRRYFGDMGEELAKKGVRNFVCPKTKDRNTRTLEERTEECVLQILDDQGSCDEGGPRVVHLMGHSMGGLIGRLLAQDPRVRNCVHSVTTIATPHQGTPMADYAIEHVTRSKEGFDIMGFFSKLTGNDPDKARYLRELRVDRNSESPENFRAQDMPDNPDVTYYSFSESMRRVPFLFMEITRKIIAKEMKARGLDKTPFGDANDGVVPEYSMVHGNYLGHLEAWHWASACHDPIKGFKTCKNVRNVLIPHLVDVYHAR